MPGVVTVEQQNYQRIAKYFDTQYAKEGVARSDVGFGFRDVFRRLGNRNFGRGSALDVGCGTGDTSLFLAQTGKFSFVKGIDLSEVGVQKAREKASKSGIGSPVNFEVCNVLALNSGNYSLIIVNDVLEYVSEADKKQFVQKLMEATKPGGINAMRFASSLPENFIEERLEHEVKLMEQPFRLLFDGSDNALAKTLQFESQQLSKLYHDAGWTVVYGMKYDAERNFVPVQAVTLVVQKPAVDRLPNKRD